MDSHMADRIMKDTMFQAIMSLSIMMIMTIYIYIVKKVGSSFINILSTIRMIWNIWMKKQIVWQR